MAMVIREYNGDGNTETEIFGAFELRTVVSREADRLLAPNTAMTATSILLPIHLHPTMGQALGDALSSNTTLQKLDILCRSCTPEFLDALIAGVAMADNDASPFWHFTLICTGQRALFHQESLSIFVTNSSLQKLAIVNADLSSLQCIRSLCQTLMEPVALRELLLDNCRLSADDAEAMGTMLRSPNTSLMELSVANNPDIGDVGASALLDNWQNTTLQKLSMARCRIGCFGAARMGELLQQRSVGIQSVDLQGNPIGPQGIAALVEGLKHNATMLTLKLDDAPEKIQKLLQATRMVREKVLRDEQWERFSRTNWRGLYRLVCIHPLARDTMRYLYLKQNLIGVIGNGIVEDDEATKRDEVKEHTRQEAS